MKLEIGESVILSWLRHVRGCVAVQMHWKPSPTWPLERRAALAERWSAIRSWSEQIEGPPIFKGGDFDQVIRQAEIDLVGIRLAGGNGMAIAVESAFHENGLQYGGVQETVGRVLKKLIRAAFALEAYVEVGEAEVIFATPRMQRAVEEDLDRHLPALEAALAEGAGTALPSVRFRIIANQDYADQILQPVLDHSESVADTSELFLRARQLMRVCGKGPAARRPPDDRGHGSASDSGGDKIGAHVRTTMAALAVAGRLPPEVLGDLLDARYCKATFRLSHPFLKRLDLQRNLGPQRKDENGYGRYWKEPLRIGGRSFLMCSQWFGWQRQAFDRWAAEMP
jgi:hypothetical protein